MCIVEFMIGVIAGFVAGWLAFPESALIRNLWARVTGWVRPTTLGTDAFSNDLFEAMRSAIAMSKQIVPLR